MSEYTDPVEAKLTAAAAILAAATALGAAIIVYFPLEKFAKLPVDLIDDSRFFTGFICMFVIVAIAAASYSKYPKSKNLTIKLALCIFGGGIVAIVVLRIAVASWVAFSSTCTIPANTLIVMAALEPQSVIDGTRELSLKGSYRDRSSELICNDPWGEIVRKDFADNNRMRRVILEMLLIGSFTCLFSSLTLLLWSLTALQPVKPAAHKPGRKSPKKV